MKYVGMTVGPIYSTINETSSPAALWFASTLFSDITRRICMKVRESFTNVSIVSPFFDERDRDGLKEGIGKYHDRVIFLTDISDEQLLAAKLNELILTVKEETVDVLGEEYVNDTKSDKEEMKKFFIKYLMIEYVVLDENAIGDSNCILKLSPYLDELELMYECPNMAENNPLTRLFLGDDENRNKYIKKSSLVKNIDEDAQKYLFNRDGRIRSIENISGISKNNGKKYSKYFVVVKADGDGMGKFLKAIGKKTDIVKDFSNACLEYDMEAARLVGEFGGMPIYAGGDDLLFLAPIVCNSTSEDETEVETIFGLCKRLDMKFQTIISEKIGEKIENIPTLSFGVSIHYYKFPLYEALNRAELLLNRAKQDESGEKHRLAVNLEKHSGQSVNFIAGGEFLDSVDEFVLYPLIKEIQKGNKHNKSEANELLLKSVGTTLMTFSKVVTEINNAYTEGLICKEENHYPWDNLFDNAGQEGAKAYIRYVQDWFYDKVCPMIDKGRLKIDKANSIDFLQNILRFSKFLIERGEENEV